MTRLTFPPTAQGKRLLDFIVSEIDRTGVAPSVREMQDYLDVASPSTVHRLLNQLEERNLIRRLPHRARAVSVTDAVTIVRLQTVHA